MGSETETAQAMQGAWRASSGMARAYIAVPQRARWELEETKHLIRTYKASDTMAELLWTTIMKEPLTGMSPFLACAVRPFAALGI